jgi:hypothetical protein
MLHTGQDTPHLVAAQHYRKFLLSLGASNLESGPLAPESLLTEKSDAR